VRDGVDRIATIARQLFTFARREPDRTRPQRADLAAALGTAGRMVEPELRGRGSLSCTLEPLPAVRADPAALEQVFLNLLINAAHALHRERGDGRIQVGAQLDGDRVLVSVRDDGEGIRPEHLPRVFDPFFTTKPTGQGTGLGLSVCHTLITQMGGEIAVESAPGTGTTVRVSLPLADPVAATTASLTPAPAPRSRILVVDDEEAIRRILARALGADHDVVAVGSAADAWQRLHEGSFDLLLVDVMMPIEGGVELAERLARERPEVLRQLVFMTGGAAGDTIDVGGVSCPVLHKPFELDQIEAMLRR
jgi:CheY-like chemotaxis protein